MVSDSSDCKYTLAVRHLNSGQNHGKKIANRRFENVAQFRYLGTTVTNQRMLSKNIKIRIYKTIVCCGSVWV
jgi:hypothetical protein